MNTNVWCLKKDHDINTVIGQKMGIKFFFKFSSFHFFKNIFFFYSGGIFFPKATLRKSKQVDEALGFFIRAIKEPWLANIQGTIVSLY